MKTIRLACLAALAFCSVSCWEITVPIQRGGGSFHHGLPPAPHYGGGSQYVDPYCEPPIRGYNQNIGHGEYNHNIGGGYGYDHSIGDGRRYNHGIGGGGGVCRTPYVTYDQFGRKVYGTGRQSYVPFTNSRVP